MLATHDSLTAYPVKTWWFRPFNFLCRCQDKTLEEQYAAGARSFDLRFARYRDNWYAAHGAMIYDITLEGVILKLFFLQKCASEPFFFRILCEDTFYRKSDAGELLKEFEKLSSTYGLFSDSPEFRAECRPLQTHMGNGEGVSGQCRVCGLQRVLGQTIYIQWHGKGKIGTVSSGNAG
jgi:hypothetical protein